MPIFVTCSRYAYDPSSIDNSNSSVCPSIASLLLYTNSIFHITGHASSSETNHYGPHDTTCARAFAKTALYALR
eukprot:6551048-Pyramimonas_sp.AAC.2